jgi:mRNA interferase MazF
MSYLRGDVVLVDFPFSSGVGSKLRPAIVVQNDINNRKLQSTILVPITSNTRYQNVSTQIALDPSVAEVKPTGLLRPSAVKCENIATVETRLVRRTIGKLPPTLVAQLDAALKAAIGLL